MSSVLRYGVAIPLLVLTSLCFSAGKPGGTPSERFLRLTDRTEITLERVMDEVRNADVLFLGEDHSIRRHHVNQLTIIRALADRGVPIALGLEMFQAERQPTLDAWVGGRLSDQTFYAGYLEDWGAPISLYRDIFLFARERGIPLVGLNVPKEITRKISEKGFSSLTAEDLRKLPPGITCNVDDRYRTLMQRLHGAHGRHGGAFEYFCEAQMVWDKAMAWHIVRYLKKNPGKRLVVLAGTIHVWKFGIPQHLKEDASYSYKTIQHASSLSLPALEFTDEDADYVLLD